MINSDLFLYDQSIRDLEGKLLCGVDEAGRGPLAGPVVAAAVILPPYCVIEGLNDSKKLTENSRITIFEIIKKISLCFSVAFVDNEKIDKMNILNATMLAMSQAVSSLDISPDFTIVDGNKLPNFCKKAIAVIKGDAKSASIAAASVVAKVTRDNYMKAMDEVYPDFGFSKHKGYPTKLHYEAIEKFGITSIHRKSFLKGRI
ncbi:MAG: ribonuclease HII [Ruminococcaceae bacterium]|nr:ribonuclease HII [Oscillospiraceae bacterium]